MSMIDVNPKLANGPKMSSLPIVLNETEIMEYASPNLDCNNAVGLSWMVMETLKGLTDAIQNDREKNTLLKCLTWVQRPHYKLIKCDCTSIEKTKSQSDPQLTETLVKRPRRIPLRPICGNIVELKDPRIRQRFRKIDLVLGKFIYVPNLYPVTTIDVS